MKAHNPNTRPRVSVGLPVYNGEQYLRDSIESVLQQDFSDLELIISDNGSTDGTEGICREYEAKDSRVRYFRHPENRGAAFNFNYCVEEARGDYFKWHAHDDALLPAYLSTCLEALEAGGEEVVVVQCKSILIDEDGKHIAVFAGERRNLDSDRPAVRVTHFVEDVSLCTYVFGLIRLPVLQATRKIGPFVASDIVLVLEFALRGQVIVLPDELQLRRVHDNSSQFANQSAKDLQAWFDPSQKLRLHPRVRYGLESMKSIATAPLPLSQRADSMLCFLKAAIARRKRKTGRATQLVKQVGASEAARQMAANREKAYSE